MERVLVVNNLDNDKVAVVRQAGKDQFDIDSQDSAALEAIRTLLARARNTGLICAHDHRQETTKGPIFRMYGRWSKPGDSDFLDALGDALVEFSFLAYTVELVNH